MKKNSRNVSLSLELDSKDKKTDILELLNNEKSVHNNEHDFIEIESLPSSIKHKNFNQESDGEIDCITNPESNQKNIILSEIDKTDFAEAFSNNTLSNIINPDNSFSKIAVINLPDDNIKNDISIHESGDDFDICNIL